MDTINKFTQFLLSQKKPVSRLTIKNYKADLKHFILWFEKEFNNNFTPQQVTPQIIEIYKNTKSVSPRSMDRHLSTLRKFFSFTNQEGLISENPFQQLSTLNSQLPTPVDPWKLTDFKNYLYVTNTSSLTIKNYVSDIEQFLSWIGKVLGTSTHNAITKPVINEYKNRLLKTGLTPRSINRKLSSLRKYLLWAQTEGLISVRPTFPDMQKQYDQIKPHEQKVVQQNPVSYSIFPPIRVLQKLSLAGLFLFDAAITQPLAKILSSAKSGLLNIKQKPLFSSKYNIGNLSSGRPMKIENYPKMMYAPLSVSTVYFPIHQKIYHYLAHSRPKWYEKYHSYTITHYLHLAILVLFTTICGFLTTQTITQEKTGNQSVLGTNIQTAENKTLAFQGKLLDTNHTPITKKTDVRFVLYGDPNTPAPLWEETQNITPLMDGTFSATLGSQNPIAKRIIADNPALYLGIAINDLPELFPRQQIATAVYTQDSQTLQGMPPITQTNAQSKNVILALDSSGNLTIGNNASPVFQATGGNFTLLGQSILLTTSPGSNGNIQINPDGNGIIDIQKPIHNTSNNNSTSGVPGAVEIADLLSVVATSSSQSAFTINQNDVGPIISASSSGTAKFTLENDGTTYIAGNVGIGKQNPLVKLHVAGTIAPSETNIHDLGTPSYRFNTLYINSIIASSSGTLGYWQRKEGSLSPSTITDALNLGNTATSSATVHLSGTDQASFIQKGNFGVGTNNPVAKLHVQGEQYVSGNVGIGTSSPNYKLEVLGSINATSDIYKNGTAFNNPDYVFEKWITGDIVKFGSNAGASNYKGLLSLEDTENFVKKSLQLPNVASARGIFERGDILLEKVEEAYIHLFDLNRKISSLIETFTTKKLISPIAQIDQIHTNIISPLASEDHITINSKVVIASKSATMADVLLEVQGSASISGILRAKKIIADEIETGATASAKLLSSALLSPDELASYSGQLSLETLNASFGKFVQGLVAIGPTSLTDTTISGSLNIGQHLTIADESINVIGADINLQPLRQGGISFLSGLVYIDTEGKLSVVNNATFGKDVTVYGNLSAGTINSIGDLIASGAATIKKLNLDIPEAIALSDTEIQASGSAGIATISAQKTSLTIYNPHITEKSLIYISPREQTDNQVLYLLRQVANTSFTVGLQQAAQIDIPFNWLIVN